MSKAKTQITSWGTVGAFLKKGACSNTLFYVLDRAFGHPLMQEEQAAMPLAGGIVQHGYQCGMIWGAAMAAGAEAFHRFGPGSLAEVKAILAAQRLVRSFEARNKNMNCLEITDLNNESSTMKMVTYFLLKGGTIGCFRMAARYAPGAFRDINAALGEEVADAPRAPVGCGSLLARKMGESDEHAAMAAGLAGGIGLSGGACGALGGAIWILGMKSLRQGAAKVPFKAPAALDLIGKFLKVSEYEFECSKIVGRPFEDVADHARFIREGGCSKIIDLLSAEVAAG